jgi:hypothetical protein
MRIWLRLGVLALVAALSTPAAAADKIYFAALVDAFDEMVLRDQGRISKWRVRTTPLKLKVAPGFEESELEILEAAIKAIEETAKLRIERADGAARPHIVLEMKNDLTVAGWHNAGLTHVEPGQVGGEMRKATIGILKTWASHDPQRLHRTLPHELLHAVGFHGHPMNFDSVMSVRGIRYSLSDWDLLFLRVLYDPKVPVGTPRILALPLVCRVMHDRLVAEANPDVADLNRAGEHPYCLELAKRPVEAKDASDQMRLGWAYLRGLGVARDLDEAETWLKRADAAGDPDAKTLLRGLEKTRAEAAAKLRIVSVAPGTQVPFAPPALETTFVTAGGYIKVVKVDGTTVHTVNPKAVPFRWSGLFFGRNGTAGVIPAEAEAAAIWPLEIGKSVTFTQPSDAGAEALENVIKVLRAEELTIAGRPVRTFVVERRVTERDPAGGVPYRAVYTYWYAPEFGFHVKYQARYGGSSTEKPVVWAVSKVVPPPARR